MLRRAVLRYNNAQNIRNEQLMASASPQIKQLQTDIDETIEYLEYCATRSERWAFVFKIGAAILTASVTVLLGLNGSPADAITYKNFALFLSACVTVVSAADAFYNPRSAWIQSQQAVVRLQNLRRDLRFYVAGLPANGPAGDLSEYKNRLNLIVQSDIDAWINTQNKDSAEKNDVSDAKVEPSAGSPVA